MPCPSHPPWLDNSKYTWQIIYTYGRHISPIWLFDAFSVSRLYIVGWTGKDVKGSGRGLFEVLSRHFPGGTEVSYESTQSGQWMYLPRFEPSACRPVENMFSIITTPLLHIHLSSPCPSSNLSYPPSLRWSCIDEHHRNNAFYRSVNTISGKNIPYVSMYYMFRPRWPLSGI
jgi:hypothetical protein